MYPSKSTPSNKLFVQIHPNPFICMSARTTRLEAPLPSLACTIPAGTVISRRRVRDDPSSVTAVVVATFCQLTIVRSRPVVCFFSSVSWLINSASWLQIKVPGARWRFGHKKKNFGQFNNRLCSRRRLELNLVGSFFLEVCLEYLEG